MISTESLSRVPYEPGYRSSFVVNSDASELAQEASAWEANSLHTKSMIDPDIRITHDEIILGFNAHQTSWAVRRKTLLLNLTYNYTNSGIQPNKDQFEDLFFSII